MPKIETSLKVKDRCRLISRGVGSEIALIVIKAVVASYIAIVIAIAAVTIASADPTIPFEHKWKAGCCDSTEN